MTNLPPWGGSTPGQPVFIRRRAEPRQPDRYSKLNCSPLRNRRDGGPPACRSARALSTRSPVVLGLLRDRAPVGFAVAEASRLRNSRSRRTGVTGRRTVGGLVRA